MRSDGAGRSPATKAGGAGGRPVINVSRDYAQVYIAWLSHEIGQAYRLPSEAEWEYACRAGTPSRYSFGDAITPGNTNYDGSDLGHTSEVGAYSANPWGLHDMHGNVWEWVVDDWHASYQAAPMDGSVWKDAGAARNPRRCVLRGGSWFGDSRRCGSAYRRGASPLSTGTATSGSESPEHFLNS
ncbi:MAG TPA: formylglycine-generating enzyme family protein [Isosphaeraceae bacterium]|nr:formylglycine-generating enzyme family protein [Isosphaeraceae bacterium]